MKNARFELGSITRSVFEPVLSCVFLRSKNVSFMKNTHFELGSIICSVLSCALSEIVL